MSPNDTSNVTHHRGRRDGDRYCRKCHYPLNGLASPGKCPECGCDFDFTLLYSYDVDPAPTLLQRLLTRRMFAFLFAVALEVVMLWIFHINQPWARHDIAWYLVFGLTFLIVWSLLFATGLDLHCEEAWHYVLYAAVLGLLIFIPVGWLFGWLKMLIGLSVGSMTGAVLHHLTGSGELD